MGIGAFTWSCDGKAGEITASASYGLYRAAGLSLRHKRPRRSKSARLRQPKHIVTAINEIWSMDFVADALFDGRRLRTLTVVDNYTRECLAIEVGRKRAISTVFPARNGYDNLIPITI